MQKRIENLGLHDLEPAWSEDERSNSVGGVRNCKLKRLRFIVRKAALDWVVCLRFRIEIGIDEASYRQFRMTCSEAVPRLHITS